MCKEGYRIPCRNTGHATHKYQILTTDVVAFLRRRDKDPGRYNASVKSGSGYKAVVRPSIQYTQHVMRAYRQLLITRTEVYPDLMTLKMIAELTGYSTKTILTWTVNGHIRWFKDGYHYYAPKELVLKHLLSEDFRNIKNKSKIHYDWIRQLINTTNKEDKDNE